jgi:phage/plasmid primase-like uncharacterized protein
MFDDYLALRSIVPKTPGLRMSYLAWEFAADRRLGNKAIVIAGDDDHGIENNPGREKALAAAEAVAGAAMFPNFSAEQRGKGLTDFNDLAIQNPELVSRQLDDVLHGVKEQGLAASQSIELAPAV